MTNSSATPAANLTDYINSTAIFSGINKIIFSKDFKGGKVNNIFGSTELDFSQADIRGVAVLDISQVFGEIKLTVPANWRVESDVSHFLAAVDDFRDTKLQHINTSKVLILTGLSVLAAVEILSA